MSLAIRRASTLDDRKELINLYRSNFADLGDNQEQRFKWHNELNPAGVGWTWILYQRDTNAAVGTTSLFPRRMYVDGRTVRVGQVMFFAVNPSHRSLGPAVMLQRATFQPVDCGELDLCYDCPPHDEGMSTFVRLKMRPNCEMNRYVLPMRSDEYLEKRLGKGTWTKPVVAAANLWLWLRRSQPNVPGLEISDLEPRFGEEFSELDKAVSTSGRIRGCRSAEVLNWLHRDFPYEPKVLHDGTVETVRCVVARRRGDLVAFAVYHTQSDNLVCIRDFFGDDLAQIGRPLLGAIVEIAAQRKMRGVYAYCSEDTEVSRVLRAGGFRRRERAARVVSYEQSKRRAPVLNSGIEWAFTQLELML